MKKTILLIFTLFLLVGCTKEVVIEKENVGNKISEDIVEEKIIEAESEMTFSYQGKLEDVSGGSASGTSQANFSEGKYDLLAEFKNLPDPEGTDFYEGWVVRKDPFAFISTGKAREENGTYSNIFSSDQDYTEYDFYVLTIEPDDGDPAPAGHILEGTMKK